MLVNMVLKSVIFKNGDAFFEQLADKYIKHNYGLFILAPSGVGKTHFTKSQKEQHWIDGDDLWTAAGAQPPPGEKWWTQGEAIINIVDQRSDVITLEAKQHGFWIMGASNFWLKPDGIVIPDWDIHVNYIKTRQETNYDGGATLDALDQVKSHIEFIKKWNTEYNVPIFKSIQDAVNSLIKL